jgi:tetratricopeptide (TPR) repeat protein
MDIAEKLILDRSGGSPGEIDVRACSESPAPPKPGRRGSIWILSALVAVLAAGVAWVAIPERTDPDRLWVEAENAFLAGRWDLARTSLKRVERIRPRTGLDLMLEAQLAVAENQPAEAFADLSRIPENHPIAAQGHLLAGRLWREQHCLKKAEAELRRALKLKPSLLEAHKELVYILGIQGRRREVDAEFHALARLTPLSHHDLFTWALTHFTQWSPDIVEDLDGFIKADPNDRYSRLAVVELLLERPGEEVGAYIQRILEPLPEADADALALRVEFAFNRGQVEEAERLLARAPANHPRTARIRGEIALRRHDFDAAIKYFKEALTGEPYDRVSPMHLAQALQLKGEKAAADVYLARVRRLNSIYNLIIRVRSANHQNQTSDLAELGKACEEAGLNEEARGWHTLAITMNPLDTNAQQALARLGRSAGQ